MQFLRTPDSQFAMLPDFPWQPHYISVPDGEDGSLRMAYIDEGPKSAPVVLLLHGEPSWSFLYRKMIPPLLERGLRVVAPDLIGFGRSDKPTQVTDYTYQRHMDWLLNFLTQLDVQGVTLFCQDWGGLLGLRLAAENPNCFARIVASNTMLPTGDMPMGPAFLKWREHVLTVPEFDIGKAVRKGCATPMSPQVEAAYNAPFPDESYKAGARAFPQLVPADRNDPATEANRAAWKVLQKWQKPFLTAFGDSDPITRGGDKLLQMLIPGAKQQHHVTVAQAGHFIQEDQGPELARVIIDLIARS